MTQRLGCSKDEIRPYLRCWRDAAIELLPDHADAFAAIDTGDMADVEDNADYQYERGLLAHYESDYEEAESWYTRAAEQDHPKAQFDLGMMYFHGEIEGLDIGECVEHAVSKVRCGCACQGSHGGWRAKDFDSPYGVLRTISPVRGFRATGPAGRCSSTCACVVDERGESASASSSRTRIS